jgi:hypothetical protein
MQYQSTNRPYFYDNARLGNDNSCSRKGRKASLEAIVPVKKIEKRRFTITKTQSSFHRGLARIELVERRENGGGMLFF